MSYDQKKTNGWYLDGKGGTSSQGLFYQVLLAVGQDRTKLSVASYDRTKSLEELHRRTGHGELEPLRLGRRKLCEKQRGVTEMTTRNQFGDEKQRTLCGMSHSIEDFAEVTWWSRLHSTDHQNPRFHQTSRGPWQPMNILDPFSVQKASGRYPFFQCKPPSIGDPGEQTERVELLRPGRERS